ncbi:hypothetical protein FQN57_000944 [Myotisia sp. PD_48]|nr:hypothetical protein FQN57_000944 [Myotisia sp. PD_48]
MRVAIGLTSLIAIAAAQGVPGLAGVVGKVLDQTGTNTAKHATGASECLKQAAQCCGVVKPVKGVRGAKHLLRRMGHVDPGSLMGLECLPLVVTGLQTAPQCAGQAVCCRKVEAAQKIGVGCTPIQL